MRSYLEKEDLLIDIAKVEGYVSESDYGYTVVLDTNLTEELITKVIIEIVKIQTMRKEAGFDVVDHIILSSKDNDEIIRIIDKYRENKKLEVLADEITTENIQGYEKEWISMGKMLCTYC